MSASWDLIERANVAPARSFRTERLRARAERRRRIAARRRAVAVSLLLLLIVGLTLMTGGTSAATSSKKGAPKAVVVKSGETLWGIADRFAPDGTDPRAYVDALVELNHLEGAPQAGQRIRLPR